MHGPQQRDVLERHLRRAVLADRDPGVGAADRRFARLIAPIRTKSYARREERAERGRERRSSEYLQPDLHADHALLGDVELDEPFGRDRLEVLRVRGVRHLAVEDHDSGRCRRRARPASRRRPSGWRWPLHTPARAQREVSSNCDLSEGLGPGRRYAERAIPPSSSMAAPSWSAGTAFPCHPSWSARNETP